MLFNFKLISICLVIFGLILALFSIAFIAVGKKKTLTSIYRRLLISFKNFFKRFSIDLFQSYLITLMYLPLFRYLFYFFIICYILFIILYIIVSILNIIEINLQVINVIKNSNFFFKYFYNYNLIDGENSSTNSSCKPSLYNLTKGEDNPDSLSNPGDIGNSKPINTNLENTTESNSAKTLAERRGMNKLSVTMPKEPTLSERYKDMILANLSNYNLYTAQKHKFAEIVSRISAGTEPFFDNSAKELLDGDYKKVVKILQENTMHQKNTLKEYNPESFNKIEKEVLKNPDYLATIKELELQKQKAEQAQAALEEKIKLNSKNSELNEFVKTQINEKK